LTPNKKTKSYKVSIAALGPSCSCVSN